MGHGGWGMKLGNGNAAGALKKFISTAAPDCGCGCIYCTRFCVSVYVCVLFAFPLAYPSFFPFSFFFFIFLSKTLPHEYIEKHIHIYRKWLPTAAPTKVVGWLGCWVAGWFVLIQRLLQRSFTPVTVSVSVNVNVYVSVSVSFGVFVRCVSVWPKVSTLAFYLLIKPGRLQKASSLTHIIAFLAGRLPTKLLPLRPGSLMTLTFASV